MTAQFNSRVILIFIFLLGLAPFLLAFWFAQNPESLGQPTSYGNLIDPAQPIDRLHIKGLDDFSQQNITELYGRWVLLHVVHGSECDTACQDSLHKTRQLRLMMNKDLTRIRRAALIVDHHSVPSSWPDDKRLLKLKATDTLRQLLFKLPIPQQTSSLLLLDPLTNAMMWYDQNFDPYQVRNDLKKLLSVSQIG